MMSLENAVRFCEDHECYECPVSVEGDKRSDIEKWDHTPCCINLTRKYKEVHVPYGLQNFCRKKL